MHRSISSNCSFSFLFLLIIKLEENCSWKAPSLITFNSTVYNSSKKYQRQRWRIEKKTFEQVVISSRRIFTATWWKFRRKLNYRPISPAVLCKRRCKHRNETSRCRRDYYGDCTIPRGRLSIHGTSNFSTTTFLVLRATHVISSSLRDTCTNVWKIIPRANKKTGGCGHR